MSDDSANSGVYLRLSPSEAEERAGYRVSDIEEPLWGLGPLGRVNLFVGSTSSGKSRLMRSILRQAEYEYHASPELLQTIARSIAKLQPLYGIPGRPGPLRDMQIRFNHSLDGFNPRSGALFSKSQDFPDRKSITILTTNNSVIQRLANARLFHEEGVKDYSKLVAELSDVAQNARELAEDASEIFNHQSGETREQCLKHLAMLRDILDDLDTKSKQILEEKAAAVLAQNVQPKRIYIPVLRNANPLHKPNTLEPDAIDKVFADTVRRQYGLLGLSIEVEVSTGQELYLRMFNTIASAGTIRRQHYEFEKFLAAEFFPGAKIEVRAIIEDTNTNLRPITISVDDVERDLAQVGDGIQSLVILMYTLFRADPGTHIFIEEPENSLHPGLQRIVLDTMLTNEFLRDKNLRIFMTTHSNHLVDLSIRNFDDASIFVFEKYPAENSDPANERFLIRPANNARMHAIASLEALNSSVLMANCSIWVEGVTDRLYIRAYLEAYWQSDEFNEFKEERKKAGFTVGAFLEDIHYAFFEYAGSNLAHYEFDKDAEAGQRDVTDKDIRMQFIANRVFLIADRDGSEDPKKIQKHDEWKEMAKDSKDFSYYVTMGREIENMVSASILKALLRKDFIDDSKVTPELIDKIADGDYQTTGLGKYLYDYFGQLDAAVKVDSGTLSNYYKTKLAEQTSKHLSDLANGDDRNAAWNLLSDEAKALAKKIDEFVRRHNPRVSV